MNTKIETVIEISEEQAALTAKIVQVVEGQFIVTEVPMLNLDAAMEVRGFNLAGSETNTRLRPILQGLPIFSGVLGPMYDGPGRVRYETPAAYDIISA